MWKKKAWLLIPAPSTNLGLAQFQNLYPVIKITFFLFSQFSDRSEVFQKKNNEFRTPAVATLTERVNTFSTSFLVRSSSASYQLLNLHWYSKQAHSTGRPLLLTEAVQKNTATLVRFPSHRSNRDIAGPKVRVISLGDGIKYCFVQPDFPTLLINIKIGITPNNNQTVTTNNELCWLITLQKSTPTATTSTTAGELIQTSTVTKTSCSAASLVVFWTIDHHHVHCRVSGSVPDGSDLAQRSSFYFHSSCWNVNLSKRVFVEWWGGPTQFGSYFIYALQTRWPPSRGCCFTEQHGCAVETWS